MPLLFANKEKHDAEVARLAMEACEHIISEMGAELHDDLIQKLSLLRLSLDKLEHTLQDPIETAAAVIAMRSEYQEVIRSIRTISRLLLSESAETQAFTQSLALLCQNMERPGTGTIHFTSDGTDQPLPPLTHNYLLRIVQELIHNAYKHSSAWHVWVRLRWHPELLTIEVEDDGTGTSNISESLDRLKKKYGTLKMRSQAICATLHYEQGKEGLLARVQYNPKSDPGSTNG